MKEIFSTNKKESYYGANVKNTSHIEKCNMNLPPPLQLGSTAGGKKADSNKKS